ncbi:nose resistant to fluoxetine protein 6-like [Hetaerina americana]|uniref:nose resistant to fluoxetine protein 6-like n=1 Tax=Hetaerina americana TaxID=62018 RepID=UPI003A7F300F
MPPTAPELLLLILVAVAGGGPWGAAVASAATKVPGPTSPAPSLPPAPPPFALPGGLQTSALLSFFAPVSPKVHNEECRNDSRRYLQELQNLTLWAAQMFDASTKFPEGILAADTYQLGHYDECVGVDVVVGGNGPEDAGRRMRGQYCLATIKFAPMPSTYPAFYRERPHHATEDEDPFSLAHDPYKSAWEKIRVTVDPSKKRRDEFFWSMCIPSSCTAQDLQTSMDAAMDTIRAAYGVRVDITVQESMCSTAKESTEYSIGDHVVGLVIAIAVTITIISTGYDMIVYQQRIQNGGKTARGMESIVLVFSAYSNLEKLGKPDRTKDMRILHGLRLFSMVFIILGHRCLFSYGGPFYNPEFLEERYRKIQDMFLLNGTLIVDTFFVLSGFLTCYSIFLELGKRKRLNIGLLYLYRWMRLTPVYMMVVAFYATLLDNLDNGPMWKSKMGLERERCEQNWWTNFLYINNYVNADQLATMWIVSLIAGFIGLASMFGGWSFYIPGRPYYIWENATYATLHRIAWSMAMCWAILGSITTGFNVLEPILSLDAITPLSRLTYCAFLTHGAVDLYIVSTLRVPQYMSFPRLFWMASGDLVMAFIFALFIHLLFEAPIGGIQKLLMAGGKRPRPDDQENKRKNLNETNEMVETPKGSTNPAYRGDTKEETQEI